MARHAETRRILGLISRTVAALPGGYGLAALASVCLARALPTTPVEAALAGILASFAVMAGAVVWVFAAASAARAWAGLLIAAAVLGGVFLGLGRA